MRYAYFFLPGMLSTTSSKRFFSYLDWKANLSWRFSFRGICGWCIWACNYEYGVGVLEVSINCSSSGYKSLQSILSCSWQGFVDMESLIILNIIYFGSLKASDIINKWQWITMFHYEQFKLTNWSKKSLHDDDSHLEVNIIQL